MHPVRTLFISDLHLGASRQAFQGKELLDCLHTYLPKTLVINGDFLGLANIDPTDPYYKNALFRHFFPFGWAEHGLQILERFRTLVEQGTRILLIPGNHDHWVEQQIAAGQTHFSFRQLPAPICEKLGITDDRFDSVFEFATPFLHTTTQGLRIWVEHGHAYANAKPNHILIYPLAAYVLSAPRRAGKIKYWYLYNILRVARKAATTALHHNAHASLTGHFHAPDARPVRLGKQQLLYLNSGDWLGNATAIIEHPNGSLTQTRWVKGHAQTRPIETGQYR